MHQLWSRCQKYVVTGLSPCCVPHLDTHLPLWHLLWGLPRSKAPGGGKSPYFKWPLQHWVPFCRSTQSSVISCMSPLYWKTISFHLLRSGLEPHVANAVGFILSNIQARWRCQVWGSILVGTHPHTALLSEGASHPLSLSCSTAPVLADPIQLCSSA